MTINSRRKGHDWERTVAAACRKHWPDAHRGMQGDGARVPDVDGTPYWIETKCGTAGYCNPLKAAVQATRDADLADDPRPIRIITHVTRGLSIVFRVDHLRDGALRVTPVDSFAGWVAVPK